VVSEAKKRGLEAKRAEYFYAGPMAGFMGSAGGFGFFLEFRDLGFFVLSSKGEAQEEYRAERQERQQEFEEAFHSNLPHSFLSKTAKKSICFFKMSSIY
jgi:hypothetical protein